ncbi:Cytochrome p450 [Thalictrum thalictroides]|uniref:Cytochrome p450 n=1 Tax=Thalictrum thalictroides TaxID=46969 RepID=A0A7J6WLE4_THATH|nr:Cytochrome p450 [Thalictrum thalictroides]
MNQFIQQTPLTNLFYVFLFFLFVILAKRLFNRSETNKLPPSPSKLPVIGNLHQLHGPPQHAFKSLAQKHGPLMLLHLGSKPTLVVSSAEIARDVMKTFDHVFSSRPQTEFAKRLTYGKDIAFTPYGDYWSQVRKVCVLQLLNTKKVKSFQFVREEEVALMMDKIKDFSLSTSVINLSEMFVHLSYDVVCRAALGKKYNDGKVGSKFKGILKEYVYLFGVTNVGDLIPSLAWVNNLNGLNARVEKSFRDVDSFINEVVEEHIEKKRRIDGRHGSGDNEEEDLVDVMLAIENGEREHGISWARDTTKAIVLDMFVAGTDTSSVVLEWAMSELIRNPNIMEDVQNEVRGIARGEVMIAETDMDEMHYLKSVIKETLRLHPPVPLLVPRESMEKVQIQGYDIPAKTTVLINTFVIGRDPKLWEEPEKFWPKRFLNGKSTSIDFKGQDFQLIPFGTGRRGCPGILFATSVIELTLANLLNRFNWALPKDIDGNNLNMEEEPGFIVHRKNDLVLSAMDHYY